MFKRYAKAGTLALMLIILAVEGYVLYRQFDVYYGQAATSDAAGVGAAVPGEKR